MEDRNLLDMGQVLRSQGQLGNRQVDVERRIPDTCRCIEQGGIGYPFVWIAVDKLPDAPPATRTRWDAGSMLCHVTKIKPEMEMPKPQHLMSRSCT